MLLSVLWFCNASLKRLTEKESSSVDYLLAIDEETVRRRRPFARRRARTLRPSAVDILSRNPCLLTLFLLEGWNVLFIAL